MDPQEPVTPAERRTALAVIAASVALFGLVLLFVPPFFLSFDEAKYIGIGYNLVDGLGPRTPFGGYFLPHAPVWSAVLALPNAWWGIDPLDTGHFLNAIAGVGLVALVGVLGGRIRPAVGGLAAAGFVGLTYLQDLTRTARLDVPAATLAVGYLLLGLAAVRRGSARWGIATGALFALAFTVKEIALPLAPVPFLAAIATGVPWRQMAKTAGWTLATAAIGVSWWFVLVANLSGVVYRLGTPAWTLLPIGLVIAAVAVLGIMADRLPSSAALERFGQRLQLGADGRGRIVVVAVLTTAWCLALTWVFAKELGVRGTALFDVPQLVRYAATWLPGVLRIVAACGALGVVLSVAAWRAAHGRARIAIGQYWLATICSAPLVLLVADVGEPPRNYLAQLGILAALAAAGWWWALGILLPRFVRAIGQRRAALALPLVLVAVLIASGSLLTVHALTFRETKSGRAREAAIETTVAWVRANAKPGEKVAIGSYLSYEISLGLRTSHPTAQVRHELAVADPTAPDGLRVSGRPPAADWIAVDVAPRNVNEYQAFAAGQLAADLRRSGATLWIYATEAATSAPEIVNALPGVPGVTEVASWSWPTPTVPIGAHIYRIDPSALAFPSDRLHVSPEALARLVGQLEKAGVAGRQTAANLAGRVVVTPTSPATADLLAKLHALAGT